MKPNTTQPNTKPTVNKAQKIQQNLDDFIQDSLNKYQFCEVPEILTQSSGKFSRIIISNKSAIPDLVIFNKKFNKADCFLNAKAETYIPYPRLTSNQRPLYSSRQTS